MRGLKNPSSIMYELTYESQAVEELTSADVQDILRESISFNEQHDITGCLIFYDRRFIQIIEGTRTIIKQLFAKIELDKRHREVRLISEGPIKERTFPQWGMAYYPLDEKKTSHYELEQFRRNLGLLADFSKPSTATTILFWKKVRLLISGTP